MEDTAFYRYIPLLSLNEVGADPRSFGMSVSAFHFANLTRQRHRPHCLLGTSTHDSKRGEDLRARIAVLSELPAQWEDCVLRMSGWAQLYLTRTPKSTWPSNNDIWLLFQTLVRMYACTRSRRSSRSTSFGACAGHRPTSVWNSSQMSLWIGQLSLGVRVRYSCAQPERRSRQSSHLSLIHI